MNDADRILHTQPLTAEAFAPWGEVLDTGGEPDRLINEGRCGRWHDRARLDADRIGLSLFRSAPVRLPHAFDLVERHAENVLDCRNVPALTSSEVL